MEYKLINKDTGEFLGMINEQQLQFLIDKLEEESEDDQDYWLHKDQLETFAEEGADDRLLHLLEKAFGDNDEVEILWQL